MFSSFSGSLQEKTGTEILNSAAEENLEAVLLSLISIFIFCSILFLGLTLLKKIRRMREIEKKKDYQQKIDDLLFSLLFNEEKISKIYDIPEISGKTANKLFQQLTIKSLITLHLNYSGHYAAKLEAFFAESGLANYSLEKLNSDNWVHIVEGIRDLSSLNYTPAYPRIVSYKNHKNNFVKTEVLLALIKLKGISELLKFKTSEVYFNDWIQSNILFVVKKFKIPAPENLMELFESKNRSILLLAVRLVNYYGSARHYTALSRYYEKTDDSNLKKEIALLLNRTEQLQ